MTLDKLLYLGCKLGISGFSYRIFWSLKARNSVNFQLICKILVSKIIIIVGAGLTSHESVHVIIIFNISSNVENFFEAPCTVLEVIAKSSAVKIFCQFKCYSMDSYCHCGQVDFRTIWSCNIDKKDPGLYDSVRLRSHDASKF